LVQEPEEKWDKARIIVNCLRPMRLWWLMDEMLGEHDDAPKESVNAIMGTLS
jgi:hypothetical protein